MSTASKIETIAATIVIVGMAVGMLILVGGGSRIVGSLSAVPNITENYYSGVPLQVCDLTAVVHGSVHDDVQTPGEKQVKIASINASVVPGSCHTKNTADALRLPDLASLLPRRSQAEPDTAAITLRLYNSLGQVIATSTFFISPDSFQIDTSFDRTLSIRSLDTNQTYTFSVATDWNPDMPIYKRSVTI